jgi:hypothetical protein
MLNDVLDARLALAPARLWLVVVLILLRIFVQFVLDVEITVPFRISIEHLIQRLRAIELTAVFGAVHGAFDVALTLRAELLRDTLIDDHHLLSRWAIVVLQIIMFSRFLTVKCVLVIL